MRFDETDRQEERLLFLAHLLQRETANWATFPS